MMREGEGEGETGVIGEKGLRILSFFFFGSEMKMCGLAWVLYRADY